MSYRAPVAAMIAMLRHVAGLDRALADGLGVEDVEAILSEAARFSEGVLAPLNVRGDRLGARFADGAVTTVPGWPEAYRAWAQAGWGALPGPVAYGGQGLPTLINAPCVEMWNGVCLSFGLAPLLTTGAIEALTRHGSEALRSAYLPKLASGEWTTTMNLTEPHVGSDVGQLRTRATRSKDGTYRISGQKIYITYGEHNMADNIVHLVLARLSDAPADSRGISLFLVPKILPDRTRNDVRCSGIEHKLGLHASPTCSMAFGDHGGAVGWLIGEENRGLACMFTMMNNARLSVGLQGVALAEAATQKAIAFAAERRQGRIRAAAGP